MTGKETPTEIGKLENGSKDPCFDCQHSNTHICSSCIDYGQAELEPIKQEPGS